MGSTDIAPPFLISARNRGEWSGARTGRFAPEEIAPAIHWIGGRVGPRAGLDAVEKRKSSCRYRESDPNHLDPSYAYGDTPGLTLLKYTPENGKLPA
jgi:hypothetical protein